MKTSPLIVLSMCAAVSASGGRPDWDYDFSIVEGDIQVPIETDRAGKVLGATPLTRASQLFPVGEAVNYVVASSLSSSDSRIASAVRDWEAMTCFRFNQCASDASCPRPYIRFQNGNGCSSPIGTRSAGVNTINLASGCSTGSTIHEIGHSLGLSHSSRGRTETTTLRSTSHRCSRAWRTTSKRTVRVDVTWASTTTGRSCTMGLTASESDVSQQSSRHSQLASATG